MTSVHPGIAMPQPPEALYQTLTTTWAHAEADLGLSVLKNVDKVVIEQQMDAIELMSLMQQPNKYKLLDENEKQLLFLEEKNTGAVYTHRAFKVIAKDAKDALGKIQNDDGKKKGTIKKQGESFGRGRNTYKINFPDNSTVEEKALIIGANIFFDYRFHFFVPPQARQRRR